MNPSTEARLEAREGGQVIFKQNLFNRQKRSSTYHFELSRNCPKPGVSINPRVIFESPSEITHVKSFTAHCPRSEVISGECFSSDRGDVDDAFSFVNGVTSGFEGPFDAEVLYDDLALEPEHQLTFTSS